MALSGSYKSEVDSSSSGGGVSGVTGDGLYGLRETDGVRLSKGEKEDC